MNVKKTPLTVIMLTLNEEFHLPGVLDNIKDWAEDVFILDSCSTDKTVDIALDYEVKIVQRRFTNFGDQWNFALQNLPIKTPWTMKLDPDERITDDLKDQIRKAILSDSPADGYTFPRRLWFMGKPLHVLADVTRVWKTGKCKFSDVIVNEHPLIDGKVAWLRGILEHFDSQDLHHWIEKQNRYTTMLAIQSAKGQQLSAKPRFFGNSLERRMFLIKFFFMIPFRYQFQWIYEIFIRGAWKDGYVGLCWARLRIESRRIRELKIKEIKFSGRLPKMPKTNAGDFDSRIVESDIQNAVMQKSSLNGK
jgi:glycosyltransferase involved in cell wall biosynthesis